MPLLTTKDPLSNEARISIEKLISSIVLTTSSAIGVCVLFGWIDPATADEATSNINSVATRLVGAIAELWPLLATLSGLWWRRRIKQDGQDD